MTAHAFWALCFDHKRFGRVKGKRRHVDPPPEQSCRIDNKPEGRFEPGVWGFDGSEGNIRIRSDITSLILSIGEPGKFKPSVARNFPDFLEKLLSQVRNAVVLIGHSEKDGWWDGVARRYPGGIHLMGVQTQKTVQSEFRCAP